MDTNVTILIGSFIIGLIGLSRDNKAHGKEMSIVGLNVAGFIILLLSTGILVLGVYKEYKEELETSRKESASQEKLQKEEALSQKLLTKIDDLTTFSEKVITMLRAASPGSHSAVNNEDIVVPQAKPVNRPQNALASNPISQKVEKELRELALPASDGSRGFGSDSAARPRIKPKDVPIVKADRISGTFGRLKSGEGYKTNPAAHNSETVTMKRSADENSESIIRIPQGQRVRSTGEAIKAGGIDWMPVLYYGEDGVKYRGFINLVLLDD